MHTINKTTNNVYFSPGNGCLHAIIDSIDKAAYSLKICVFTISDDRITQAILKAHYAGIEVKIITDNEKLFDKGSDIRELAAAGLSIRVDNTANHMHHKFAIVDNQELLTGSYNWTRSAALYNHENLLVTTQSVFVTPYLLEFDKLWKEMTPF